jgi:hypothetical protein
LDNGRSGVARGCAKIHCEVFFNLLARSTYRAVNKTAQRAPAATRGSKSQSEPTKRVVLQSTTAIFWETTEIGGRQNTEKPMFCRSSHRKRW